VKTLIYESGSENVLVDPQIVRKITLCFCLETLMNAEEGEATASVT